MKTVATVAQPLLNAAWIRKENLKKYLTIEVLSEDIHFMKIKMI